MGHSRAPTSSPRPTPQFLLPALPSSVDDSSILPLPEAERPGDTLDSCFSHTHIQPVSISSCFHLRNTAFLLHRHGHQPAPPGASPTCTLWQSPPPSFCRLRGGLFLASPPEGASEHRGRRPAGSAFPAPVSLAISTAKAALRILARLPP